MSIPAHLRAAVAKQWFGRAIAEREAERRFERLEIRLRARGVHESIVEMANTARADERRHQITCDEMTSRWGRRPTSYAPGKFPGRLFVTERQLVREVVGLCCIAETINCAYLSEVIRGATDQGVRGATRSILKDEVMHARLGWCFLKARGSDLSWLSPHLVPLLSMTVNEELIEGRPRGLSAPELGLLDIDALRQLFSDSLIEVVLPGLARFGADTKEAEAWARALGNSNSDSDPRPRDRFAQDEETAALETSARGRCLPRSRHRRSKHALRTRAKTNRVSDTDSDNTNQVLISGAIPIFDEDTGVHRIAS